MQLPRFLFIVHHQTHDQQLQTVVLALYTAFLVSSIAFDGKHVTWLEYSS